MKRILFTVLVANALIILSLTSCEKDNSALQSVSNNTTPIMQPVLTTISLVANDWKKEMSGIYVSAFPGVLSPANTSSRPVKIYLEDNGKEIQINHFIPFMDGQLWATSTQTDVAINYRGIAAGLPFSRLNIKVVVE